jgi:cold shock CspA family protein
MADSFSKKENFKKKLQKQKEKAARREERKDSNDKGKSLDDMIMYVDANGQLTSTPPVRENDEEEFDLNSIQLGAAPIEAEEVIKKGTVTFLSEKGYGFITEERSKETIFFHSNNATEVIKKGNRVSFEVEKSPKGLSAIDIKIIK